MTMTEDFVGSLHLIAASGKPLNNQKAAVGQVFERFLREADYTLGGDRQRIRVLVAQLELELMQQALPARSDSFADLRDHARSLIEDWLSKNG